MIERVVSGGQSGVDRAALDVALELGIPCGGWCPKGRLAEDGPLPERYPLRETPSPAYRQRTEWNVRDSDGTLILTRGTPTGGTAHTVSDAAKHRRPCLILDMDESPDPIEVVAWLREYGVEALNVAGPRESTIPGIGADARLFLRAVLAMAQAVGA